MAYVLNYNTVQAAMRNTLLPMLYDNIFKDNHYLLSTLKANAEDFKGPGIEEALEYSKATNIGWLTRGGIVGLSPEEIATKATFTPKMLTGSITIYLEDELENMTDEAIFNLLKTRTKNLQRSLEEFAASHIWTRGSTLADSNAWNTIDYLVNNSTSVDVGDILSSGTVPTWWLSPIIDFTGANFTGDPTSETDLSDPDSDVYLEKCVQQIIGAAKFQTGTKPNMVVMPQFLFDLLDHLIGQQKRSSSLTEKIVDMGFDAMAYRGVAIVADDDMVAAQTGNTDGRIYAFNTDHLKMRFNSGAKFTMRDFVQAPNQNAKSALVNAYGNITISNRGSQACGTGFKSPKTYVNVNSL